MNEDNTQKLFKNFPRLYRGDGQEKRNAHMNWGFECGDGWFRLLYDLSSAIEREARKLGIDPASEDWPRTRRVKEKFGTLRYYVCTPGPDADDINNMIWELNNGVVSFRPVASIGSIRNLVEVAEAQSEHICVTCGLAGTLRTEGWWKVLCDSCQEKRRVEHEIPD